MTRRTRATWSIWVLAYAIGPMTVGLVAGRPLVDNSFLWHITAGRVQSATGRVLTEDPFSFMTVGMPWRTQSWLVELLYSWGDDRIGLLAGHLVAPMVGGLFFLVVAAIVRSAIPPGPASALVLAGTTIVMLPFLQPRPVIFSYLGLALLVLMAPVRKRHWAIPLVLWVWAGVHGSFVLGFVFLGLIWLTRPNWRLFKTGVAGLVLVNFTAHGWGIWNVLVSFSQAREALDRITEWRHPDLLSPQFIPILAALAVLVAWYARDGLTKATGLPLFAWFVFGLTATRTMPLVWIVALPEIARSTEGLIARLPANARLGRPVLTLLTALMLALPVAGLTEGMVDGERFPVEAAEHLDAARVFHDDVTGGYLIYSQWPERLVYVDDRAELFQDILVDFADAKGGQADWESVVDATGATQALVRRTDAIASLLRDSNDWTVLFEDENFLLLDRR